LEIMIRVTVVYLFVVFGLRVIGRRELSDMSPLDLVTLLLIPEIAAQALPGGEDFSLINGLTGVATLFLLVFPGLAVALPEPAGREDRGRSAHAAG